MTASQLGTVVGRGAGVAESNVQSTSWHVLLTMLLQFGGRQAAGWRRGTEGSLAEAGRPQRSPKESNSKVYTSGTWYSTLVIRVPGTGSTPESRLHSASVPVLYIESRKESNWSDRRTLTVVPAACIVIGLHASPTVGCVKHVMTVITVLTPPSLTCVNQPNYGFNMAAVIAFQAIFDSCASFQAIFDSCVSFWILTFKRSLHCLSF
jgi:hypothetical protein